MMGSTGSNGAERVDVVVIGGGQAGLGAGHELLDTGLSFVILDANARVGDAWRNRWDSLRLFTPARFSALPGMPHAGPQHLPPTKDEMADYLEAYADRFNLPVRTGTRVERVSKSDDRYLVQTSHGSYDAAAVVVATGAFHHPWTPGFARDLGPGITQIHSSAYRGPHQLQPGPVLIVGAGNSGADISLEVARAHPTYLAGRHPGHVPFHIDTFKARFLIRGVRFVGTHVITRRTPLGRKLIGKLSKGGDPLVRVKPKDILAAGVERVGKVAGVEGGMPVLEDGRALEVANVIWATGFRRDFGWIDLPVADETGDAIHDRGIAPEPGLYYIGQPFQFAATSDTITGIDRDARYIVRHLAAYAGGKNAAGRIPARTA